MKDRGMTDLARKAAKRYGLTLTEALDRYARQLAPCAECKQWKPANAFDLARDGKKFRCCRACRKPPLTKQQQAANAAKRWVPPPEAKKAAAQFLDLMDVPSEWRVPK